MPAQRSADPGAHGESFPALAELVSALDGMPIEALERLAPRFTPSALRRRRLAERDGALRCLAELGGSGRELAAGIELELRRYAAAAWRFARGCAPPADPRRRDLHRVLTLNFGKPPGVSTIRRALAGIGAGSKSPPLLSQPDGHHR